MLNALKHSDRFRKNFRRWATGLLDQQIRCWGRDIGRSEGNVFLDLGMCRYRSSEPNGGTLYKATLEGNAEVWLWGFGLLCRDHGVGCVFLRRYGFDPLPVERPPEHPVHRPEEIVPLVRPTGPGRTVADSRGLAAAVVTSTPPWCKDVSVAFFDAYLKGSEKAKFYLKDGFAKLSDKTATFECK